MVQKKPRDMRPVTGCRCGEGRELEPAEIEFFKAKRKEFPRLRPCPLAGWQWLVIDDYCPSCRYAKRE